RLRFPGRSGLGAGRLSGRGAGRLMEGLLWEEWLGAGRDAGRDSGFGAGLLTEGRDAGAGRERLWPPGAGRAAPRASAGPAASRAAARPVRRE
ncbi:MAG: hypothetical protein ACK5TY_02760, partial [Verrucomicrobiota bacterium]